ncbi:MAG: hypothetical protein JWN93_1458 [Hyphomicrobiales bacterium]|nr:hypothetical protein [Hyphomicrobiales bacterium]
MSTWTRSKLAKTLSLGVIASALALGLTLIMMPVSGPVEAREETSAECRVIQVALDEGYSISRVEERRVCE